MSVIDDFLNKNGERAERWLEIISTMLNDEEAYGYAQDTLTGIYDDVEKNGRITDAQVQAVQNIQDKPSHNYGRRRY